MFKIFLHKINQMYQLGIINIRDSNRRRTEENLPSLESADICKHIKGKCLYDTKSNYSLELYRKQFNETMCQPYKLQDYNTYL